MARKLLISVLIVLAIFLSPFFFSEKLAYDPGRDTFRIFGNGRFQLYYPENDGYDFADAKNNISVNCDHIVDWLEKDGKVYLVASHGERHIIDMHAITKVTFQGNDSVPATQREVFEYMAGRTKARRFIDDFGSFLCWVLADLLVLVGLVVFWVSQKRC